MKMKKKLTDEELYERAARDLAQMKCPDFSDVDGEIVCNAFLKVFSGLLPRKEWLEAFKKKVSRFSNGKVVIKEDDSPTVGALGPAAYLLLVSNEKTIKFIFGPYKRPFEFYG